MHAWQLAWALSAWYVPVSQFAHTLPPCPDWYVPASQSAHTPMPVPDWYFPEGHCVQ